MQQVATYERVASVCEQFKLDNIPISGRAVMRETGGSMSTVLAHIKEWEQNAARKPNHSPNLSPELQTTLLREIALAQDAAVGKIKESAEQAAIRENEALTALSEAEKKIEHLNKLLNSSRKETEEIKQNSEKRIAVLDQKIETLESRVKDLEKERKQLIESAEISRTETAKIQLQIERADQATEKSEKQNIELAEQLITAQQEKNEFEKLLALSEQKVTGLTKSLEEKKASFKNQSKENKILRDSLSELEKNDAILKQRIEYLNNKTEEDKNIIKNKNKKITDFRENISMLEKAHAQLQTEFTLFKQNHKK